MPSITIEYVMYLSALVVSVVLFMPIRRIFRNQFLSIKGWDCSPRQAGWLGSYIATLVTLANFGFVAVVTTVANLPAGGAGGFWWLLLGAA